MVLRRGRNLPEEVWARSLRSSHAFSLLLDSFVCALAHLTLLAAITSKC